MSNKYKFFLLLLILIIIIYYNVSYERKTQNIDKNTNDIYIDEKLKVLSKLLNEAMGKVGKLTCELNKNDVSVRGGWCSKISGKNSPQHMTDEPLAKALSKFLTGKKVASFGDGPGVYKELLLEYGEVLSYDSFDGAPFAEETTNKNVQFLDLSVPIYHLNKYDWVISLEVAEHIPAEFEHIYIDNLVRHATQGVILSWAKIGQGGHSHINNRDFEYVKTKMEEKGLMHDFKSSINLQKQSTFTYFQSNINVFLK